MALHNDFGSVNHFTGDCLTWPVLLNLTCSDSVQQGTLDYHRVYDLFPNTHFFSHVCICLVDKIIGHWSVKHQQVETSPLGFLYQLCNASSTTVITQHVAVQTCYVLQTLSKRFFLRRASTSPFFNLFSTLCCTAQ